MKGDCRGSDGPTRLLMLLSHHLTFLVSYRSPRLAVGLSPSGLEQVCDALSGVCGVSWCVDSCGGCDHAFEVAAERPALCEVGAGEGHAVVGVAGFPDAHEGSAVVGGGEPVGQAEVGAVGSEREELVSPDAVFVLALLLPTLIGCAHQASSGIRRAIWWDAVDRSSTPARDVSPCTNSCAWTRMSSLIPG